MKVFGPGNQLLHLAYEPEIAWVYPIWNKLNDTRENREETTKLIEQAGLGDLAVAMATKLRMLVTCADRIRRNRVKLDGELLSNKEEVVACAEKGYAYPLKDRDFVYEFLLDLEMFMLLTRSTYEITGKFITTFFSKVLGRQTSETQLIEFLKSRSIDTGWIGESRDNRILFFHNTAPWLGAVVPGKFVQFNELVLFKKGDVDLSRREDFISLTDLHETYKNFTDSLVAIRDWIVAEIRPGSGTI